MTARELTTAKKLLEDRADRFDDAILDGGGYCLTAYWLDGSGQKLFYTLDEVRRHIDEH